MQANRCRRAGSRQEAVITTGGNLLAKYVIHTVGPVWHGGTSDESRILASAYLESLKLAEKYQLKSVSFPSISTGAYGYPVSQAATTALQTTISFFKDDARSIKDVIFVLFDSRTYEAYQKALQDLVQSQN
jgi:O-acetyl-ADP-ribose deacetylase (regulator of RNase III)